MASADETARFSLELDDGISGPAATGEDALTALATKLTSGQRELSQMNAAMRKLKQGGLAGSQSARQLGDRIDALKKSLGVAQSSFIELGGDISSLGNKAVPPTADALEDLLGKVTSMGGPVGGLGSRLAALAANPMAAVAAAALAVVAAMGALIVAVGAGTAALLRFGLAAKEARRSSLLHLEGLTTIRNWHGVAAGSATELQASIDRVSDSAAIGGARVQGYAEQLYRAGLRGAALEDALRGVSTVAAVQGEGMANRWKGMAIAAARTGGDVRRMADDIERRLGPVAAKMALGWGRQMERMRKNIDLLFDGLRIEGLLKAVDSVLSMFSQASIEGRALKQIFTSVFQPFIDGMSESGPSFRRFLQGMVIAALDVAIAFVRLKNWIRDAFAGSNLSSLSKFVDMADLGKLAVYGLVAALGASVVTFAALGALALWVGATLTAPFIVLGGLAAGVGAGLVWITLKFKELGEWLSEMDWSSLGKSLIDGLISGITAGVHRVLSTVRSLGDSMTGALRSVLEIRSPSQVFARAGREIPRGLAVGVDQEAGVAQRAVSDVVSVPQGGALGAGGIGGRGGVTVSFDGGIHVHAGNSEDAPDTVADRIREAIESALEGLAVQMGATT